MSLPSKNKAEESKFDFANPKDQSSMDITSALDMNFA